MSANGARTTTVRLSTADFLSIQATVPVASRILYQPSTATMTSIGTSRPSTNSGLALIEGAS